MKRLLWIPVKFFLVAALLLTGLSALRNKIESTPHDELLNGISRDETVERSKNVRESRIVSEIENNFAEEKSEMDIGTVVYVIDGDTLLVNLAAGDCKIRLIGVDTPESVAWQEYLDKTGKENTAEGDLAKEFTKSLLKHGDIVYLDYDVERTDTYGRTLAYVYLSDGRMLQDILLENGMAQIMTIAPNVKNSDRFYEIQVRARESKTGIWNGDFWS